MSIYKKPLFCLISFTALIVFISCKKENSGSLASNLTQNNSTSGAVPSATTAQLNTVAFQKTQDYYLWNTNLPASLDGNAFADPAAVMTNIRQYSLEPVSSSTASASELLINNLKPYMDVRLIGPANTHGKPVGFFPIEDGEWYVFPVSFKTVNKNNEGNYYTGFAPNAFVPDGLDKDWGDVSESCLASAIRNISSGSYKGVAETTYSEPMDVAVGNRNLEKNILKITVDRK